MVAQSFGADTAFVVHLRSYSFFHSGRERLQTQVLKRTWEHIPGSTLYGAVAAALIRLDGLDEAAQPFETGPGGYHRLLGAVKERQIRFTPLLPVPANEPLVSAKAYCRQAVRLHAAVYADKTPQTARAQEKALFHTTPHAPLSRTTEQIHGDQLFVMRTHRPLLDYYGFVFATAGLRPLLERALRYLPFMPLGGQGKFSLVEGEIAQEVPLARFRADLEKWQEGIQEPWLRLLTPLVLQDGSAETPLLGTGRQIEMSGLRRYRVWRTGRYYNAQDDDFDQPLGIEPEMIQQKLEEEGRPRPENEPLLYGGRESAAVRAVPERSRFQVLKNDDDVAAWFVEGVGNPSWTYLGWGQVVIE